MSHYPDPERYPVGSPEREAEQQRKNELMRFAVERQGPTNPPASRAREDETMSNEKVEQMLAELRAERGSVPPGELRDAYTDACDRLAVLSSHISWAPLLAPSGYVPTAGADGFVYLKAAVDPGRRERIALAFLVAMTSAGDSMRRNDGPDKYMIVNAIDAADRFIAELDRKGEEG